MVVGQQLVVGDVSSDRHVEIASRAGATERRLEQADHILGALVVGRHTGPDQPERSWQPLKDIHLDAVGLQQLGGGIAGRRTGSDDRDPQTTGVDALAHRHRRCRPSPQRLAREEIGVDIAKLALAAR